MANASRITAAFSQTVEGLPESIVFFPKGRHTIQATRDGKPVKVNLRVGQKIAAAFQSDLEKRQASNVRPFGGFDHKPGPASLIPKEFRWDDEKGLVLDVEWTAAGRAAIEGRNYSYFSPMFLERNGEPIGLADHGEIGSLVNDPAFEEIPRIAANKTKYNPMELLTQIGLLSEEDAAKENALDLATMALAKLKTERDALQAAKADAEKRDEEQTAAIAAANAARDEALQAVAAAKEEKADLLVSQAISAGRIAPKDAVTAAFWKQSILSNPASVEVLNAIPARIDGKLIVANRNETAPSVKEMGKDDFAKLSPQAKSEFSLNGGRIV